MAGLDFLQARSKQSTAQIQLEFQVVQNVLIEGFVQGLGRVFCFVLT